MNVQALERLELMRHRLDTDGRVRVSELADELDVSEMTIRRDLDMLVDEGVAQRVRGGAVAVGPQEFATRFRQHARAKARLAEKLLDMIGTGGAIGIDAVIDLAAARRTARGRPRSHRAHQRTGHVPGPAGTRRHHRIAHRR